VSIQPPQPQGPPLPPQGSLRCPRCSATIGPDQDWCLECGAPARTRLAQTPNWQLPTAAIGAIVLLAGAMLAFAFVKLTDDGDLPASTTPTAAQTVPTIVPTVITPPAGTAPVPGTTTPIPGATTPVQGTTTPGAAVPVPGSTVPVPTTTPAPSTTTPATTTPKPTTTTATTPSRSGKLDPAPPPPPPATATKTQP